MSSILLVCRANVCRSPLAAGLLARRFRDAGTVGVSITSAGTEAYGEADRCALARETLALQYPGATGAVGPDPLFPAGAPRLLDRDQLRSADLILTMGASHRSHIVSMDPSARRRTYTLKEAALFASVLLDDVPVGDGSSLQQLASRMHGLRGVVRLPEVDASWWRRLPRGEAGPDTSIADGHSRGPRAHRRALAEVTGVVGSLAPALSALLAPSKP